jgi:hypothetical protein
MRAATTVGRRKLMKLSVEIIASHVVWLGPGQLKATCSQEL